MSTMYIPDPQAARLLRSAGRDPSQHYFGPRLRGNGPTVPGMAADGQGAEGVATGGAGPGAGSTPRVSAATPRIPDENLARILGVIADMAAAGDIGLASAIEAARLQLGASAFTLPTGTTGANGGGIDLNPFDDGSGGDGINAPNLVGFDYTGRIIPQGQGHGGYNAYTARGPSPRREHDRSSDDRLTNPHDERQRTDGGGTADGAGAGHADSDGGNDAGTNADAGDGSRDAGASSGDGASGSEWVELPLNDVQRGSGVVAMYQHDGVITTYYDNGDVGEQPVVTVPTPEEAEEALRRLYPDPGGGDSPISGPIDPLVWTLLPAYLRAQFAPTPLRMAGGPGANYGPEGSPPTSASRGAPVGGVPLADEPRRLRATATAAVLLHTAHRILAGVGPGIWPGV